MDCGLFRVRFLFSGHKNGAAAPVDYLSTFATAPFIKYQFSGMVVNGREIINF